MPLIRDLLSEVAQVTRRCPTATMIQAYRTASRDFCAQTRWLRQDLAVTTEADLARYSLVAQSGPSLEPIGVRLINADDPANNSNWWVRPLDATLFDPALGPAAPTRYAYDPEGSILLYQTPDKAYDLVVTTQMQPTRDAVELPEALLRKWETMIQCGALAYLLDLPGEPWSNPARARLEGLKFQAGINNAKADEQRGYNTGTVRVRPRPFGGGFANRGYGGYGGWGPW
jgi:hypothetical protein